MGDKKIAVVGAGISGLLACKHVLSKGFNPIIFESRDRLGGVWTETFEITRLQTPKLAFQFSDFPWPSSIKEDFPDHHRVLEYVEAYARRFDLMSHVKFRSKVIGIRYDIDGAKAKEAEGWKLWGGSGDTFGSKGKWEVKVEKSHGDNTSMEVSPNSFFLLLLSFFFFFVSCLLGFVNIITI